MTAKDTLITLLRFEIAGSPLPEGFTSSLTDEIMRETISIANRHSITHMIADAVQKNGIRFDDKIMQYLKKQKNIALMRYVQMDDTLEKIKNELTSAEIPFMPLKGSVINQYYPEAWLRNSCDMDILVRKEDLEYAVKVLCSNLGFKAGKIGSHDVSLFKGQIHIELHFNLGEEETHCEYASILKNVWKYSYPIKDGFEYVMQDEMFYLYHIVHMKGHFASCGVGVRHFIDIWILNHAIDFDKQKRESFLEDGNILVFAREAQALADYWLSETEETALTKRMEKLVLMGATYGTREQRATLAAEQSEGTIRFIFKRIFLPYSELKNKYPKLQDNKWLMPFYWLVRLFSAIFNRDMRQMGVKEINCVNNLQDSQISEQKDLMNQLGLK